MKLLSHSSPVFPVEDPLKTAEFYRDTLGFDIRFQWEDPPTYVVVNRDDAVGIHLVKKEDDFKPSNTHTSLFIFVNDIDQLYQEYKKAGAEIVNDIGTRDYGMRDFDIKDPNGFVLAFGQSVE